MKLTETRKKLKYIFSPLSIVLLAIFVLGLAVLFIARANTEFADFWNRYIASVPRGALAYITNIIPFSLAETFIITLPLWIAVIIRYVIKHKVAARWSSTLRFSVTLLSIASLMLSVLNLCFSPGYSTSSLDKKLDLERRKVTAEELYITGDMLTNELSRLAEQVNYSPDGESFMPYTFGEMTKKLNEAYSELCDDHSFIPRLYSRPKKVMLSEPWTYTHIAGVYTYFTGEANVNVNFPDYTLPFTAAHEMAHQRGIAREDEANFIAFLVCMESDDPYIRYSACLSMYEYVANVLYRADKDMYRQLYQNTDGRIKAEEAAYGRFFEKYKDNIAADVSGAVNDSYLQSQGQSEGSRSYGLVVDLAVAYILGEK